jgi:hypothetical protein
MRVKSAPQRPSFWLRAWTGPGTFRRAMADAGSDRSQPPRPPRPGARPPLRMTAASAGLEFTASILAGLFVGWWADRRIGTEPWLLILGTFVGAAAGFYNLYRVLTTGQRPSGSRKGSKGPE